MLGNGVKKEEIIKSSNKLSFHRTVQIYIISYETYNPGDEFLSWECSNGKKKKLT